MSSNSDWKTALAVFIERAVTIQPGGFLKIILYGSRAREDFASSSDVDLLVIVPTPDHKKPIEKEISRIANELSLEYDLVLSVFVVDEQQYKTSFEPWLVNIRREGKHVA